MSEIQARTLHDKSSWGEGPWQKEHDLQRWQDSSTEYWCQLERSSEGHLTGYVRIEEGHPLFRKDWLSKEVRALQVGRRNVITVFRPDDTPPSYWLGFACNGMYESSPLDRSLGMGTIKGSRYITWEEVKEDVLSLARQIHKHER